RANPRSNLLRRSAALLRRTVVSLPADAVLVPEFRHKDVPLARLVATLSGSALIVDPLVSRLDTQVGDWGSASAASLQGDHNRPLAHAAVRFADLLLCDTAAHAAYFQTRHRVPRERCAVVPVGFDDTVFQPRPEPTGPFEVAFFGSFLPLH